MDIAKADSLMEVGNLTVDKILAEDTDLVVGIMVVLISLHTFQELGTLKADIMDSHLALVAILGIGTEDYIANHIKDNSLVAAVRGTIVGSLKEQMGQEEQIRVRFMLHFTISFRPFTTKAWHFAIAFATIFRLRKVIITAEHCLFLFSFDFEIVFLPFFMFIFHFLSTIRFLKAIYLLVCHYMLTDAILSYPGLVQLL